MNALASAVAYYSRNPFEAYDPTIGMLPFHASASKRRLVRAANQCLAAETEIDGPAGTFRIGDVAEGEPVAVWARTPDGIREALGVKLPRRESAPLHRVRMESGRSFLATAPHRVLTVNGWREVGMLLPGVVLVLWADGNSTYDRVAGVTFERVDTHHDIRVPMWDNFLVDGLTHHNCGKTISGAWEAWAHLTGRHRWRDIQPSSGMCMIADLDNAYPLISEKLYQTAPMDLLDTATKYVAGKGWYTHGSRYILTKLGHRMIFRGGEGSAMSAESATVGWLWIDEPPKEDRFSGAVSRVAVAEGPVWMTFTPVSRPTGWLKRRVEGDPDTGEMPREQWEQIRVHLTQRDCTTISGRVIRSQASIDRQTASYSPWELGQRVHGEWEGIAVDRKLVGFSERCVITPDQAPADFDPGGGDSLRFGLDHGQLTGKQVVNLSLWQRKRVWMLAECVFQANTGPRDVALAMVAMLKYLGLTIHDVGKIVGDANSAGLMGGGAKYNTFIERELCDILKTSQLPCDFTVPDKRRGSVDVGETAMSSAMRDGRYFVVDGPGMTWREGRLHGAGCGPFIRAARAYTGREEDLKNNVDAARYGIADLLLRSGTGAHVPVATL